MLGLDYLLGFQNEPGTTPTIDSIGIGAEQYRPLGKEIQENAVRFGYTETRQPVSACQPRTTQRLQAAA